MASGRASGRQHTSQACLSVSVGKCSSREGPRSNLSATHATQRPPVPEPPARRKRQSTTAGTAGGSSHHNTPMPPATNNKPNLWPCYKRGMSLADEPNPNLKTAAMAAPSGAGKALPPRGPTGAGASPTGSCRSTNCSDPGCCSPAVPRKPGSRAASPLLGIAPSKEKGHNNPLEIRSPLLSAEAAAEQTRLRREQAEEYEEMEGLLKEQEARLAEQEGGCVCVCRRGACGICVILLTYDRPHHQNAQRH